MDDLVASWRRDFGIDVGAVFAGVSSLRLCRDRETARVYFDPPVTGPQSFYGQLRGFAWYQPASKEEHRAAGALIGPDDRVLDIGAGSGAFAEWVGEAAYMGLEVDPRGIAQARSSGRDVCSRSLAETADAVTSGALQSFTVVTAFQVLEHVPDPDAFVAAALRCLAPRGRLILGVPDAESYLSSLPDFVLNAPPHHLTWWDRASLGRLLQRHGVQAPETRHFPVEPWERRLWWMARVTRLLTHGAGPRFGASLRGLKVAAWLASGALQVIRPPARARGATLLAVCRKASGSVREQVTRLVRVKSVPCAERGGRTCQSIFNDKRRGSGPISPDPQGRVVFPPGRRRKSLVVRRAPRRLPLLPPVGPCAEIRSRQTRHLFPAGPSGLQGQDRTRLTSSGYCERRNAHCSI